jgi:hypothetical protein
MFLQCVGLTSFRYANFAAVALFTLDHSFWSLIFFVFDKHYYYKHYIGSSVAVLGTILIFVSDFNSSGNAGLSDEVKGDMMCVLYIPLQCV